MITEAHNIFLNQITFTEEILNGKLHFLCSESSSSARNEKGPYC